MRFEKVVWTLLAMFLMGSAALGTDPFAGNVGTDTRYESADGGKTIPPSVMDGGTSTTTAVQLTK